MKHSENQTCANRFSRRDFLRFGALGAGSLVATSALPAFADDPSVFPKRGTAERLVLAYQHIHIGLKEPFSILHISDTHLSVAYPTEADGADKLKSMERRTRTFGGRQEEALRDSLAWAKENVDYVLHTGDLIDWQSEANFDLVKKYYGSTMFGSVGNHEFYTYLPGEKHTWQEPFKERSWQLLKAKYPIDARFSAKVINGVNFVCLDDVFGTVQPDQVERFRAEVQKGLPIILCMHVPFHTPAIWRASAKFWRRPGKFRAPARGSRHARLHRVPEGRAVAEGHLGRASAHHGAGSLFAHGDAVRGGRQLHVPRRGDTLYLTGGDCERR